jgi:4-phospho-D-threonate 3-dehydrogenase / 4-phospho-D-erythronate 3-dehydrogenase
MKNRPLIGISVGDPGGIGTEVTVKALAVKDIYDISRPLVVSDFGLMMDAVKVSGVQLGLNCIDDSDHIENGRYEFGTIDVLNMNNVDMSKHVYKKILAENGKSAFEYIEKVIELAMAGKIDATVTGPIHKEALNLAGFHYAGHTEIYSELTNTKDYVMMLVDDNFRIAHVSTHVSLRKACDLAKKDRILKVIELTRDMLGCLDVENPRIAVAGLNPHAGEGGLFGDEEEKEIAPAIESAKRLGINAQGPFPPDTIFSRAKGGEFDAVIAMYHDQGHVALKTAGFVYDKDGRWSSISGVNVTLGLPIIRTSVDHGVAFDKAGDGIANPQSMIQAIKLAVQLVLDLR